jgi:hypothetical protein
VDFVGAVDEVAAWLVGMVTILQQLTAHVLHWPVGPFAQAAVFSMVISIIVHVAKGFSESAIKRVLFSAVYLTVLFGLLVGTVGGAVEADAAGSDLSVGSDLSIALMVLLLILATVAVTVLIFVRQNWGTAIQVALLMGSLGLQWVLTSWTPGIEAWLVCSVVAIIFVLVVH